MDYTYEQLKHKTVSELREIAKGNEHEALQGYTQLNKEHLLVALSKALGIKHEHHDVVGVDKASIKARIRDMNVRFVAEADPTRQALLEIYAATVLNTPYNDFENH